MTGGGGESVDHFGVPENALHSVQRKLGFALSLSPTHFYTHSTRQRLEAWAERAEKKQEVEMEYKKEEKLILLLFLTSEEGKGGKLLVSLGQT